MSTFYGQPSVIDQAPMPPVAVNIVSSTTGAGTVITANSHGLQTGMAVIINAHLANTNANGIWIATVLSANTYKISTFAGFPGTFVAGNNNGVNTGTSQSLGFPGITLPEDAVTAQDAASVNTPLEALADMTAWLAYKIHADLHLLAGGLATLNGNLFATGSSQFDGPVAFTSTAAFTGSTSLSAMTVNGTASFNSLTRWRAPSRPTDAATINTSATAGEVIILPTPGASPRNVVVADGTNGDRILVVCPNFGAEGYYFTVKRASGTIVAQLWNGSIRLSAADVVIGSSILLEVEGGVWRGMDRNGYVIEGAGW